MQKEFEAVQAEFFEERSQLMAKYEKLYEPIFNKVCVLLVRYLVDL